MSSPEHQLGSNSVLAGYNVGILLGFDSARPPEHGVDLAERAEVEVVAAAVVAVAAVARS